MNQNKIDAIAENAKRIFVAEQKEAIKRIMDVLLDFRLDQNNERLDDLKRFFHTIKGSAAMFKLHDLAETSAFYEKMMVEIKDNSDFDHRTFSKILEGIAIMKREINHIAFSMVAETVTIKNDKGIETVSHDIVKDRILEYVYSFSANKILAVDDDPAILEMLGELLTSAGYDVTKVNNPKSALEIVKSKRFDLGILDITMPEMSGLELYREMENARCTLPVIFLTSEVAVDYKVTAFEIGAHDYILKPFDPKELLARVENLMKTQSSNKSKMYIDKITSAYNRNLLDENIKNARSRYLESREPFSIGVINIDNFSQFNINNRFELGNHILKEFYEALRNILSPENQIYRLEGDEFVILFPNREGPGSYKLLEDARRKISNITIDTQLMLNRKITFSGGIYSISDEKTDLLTMLEAAKHCMYESKKNGKNRITLSRRKDEGKKSENESAKGKIHIIDDSVTMVYYIKNHLERMGYHVTFSNNGELGVVMCKAIRPDIIIVDLVLPGIDGLEVVTRIKQDPLLNNSKIVIVTAQHKKENVATGMILGVDCFLAKPFTVEELEMRIKKLVGED